MAVFRSGPFLFGFHGYRDLEGLPHVPDYGQPAAQPLEPVPLDGSLLTQVAPSRGQVLASPSLPELILWGPELGTICSLLSLCSGPKAIDWLQQLLVRPREEIRARTA